MAQKTPFESPFKPQLTRTRTAYQGKDTPQILYHSFKLRYMSLGPIEVLAATAGTRLAQLS